MTNFETARFTVTYVSYHVLFARFHREVSHLNLFFVSIQSRNCDGGLQELSTAAKCIRDVFPDSVIIPERNNAYPLKVVISVESEANGDKKIVWSGKQQNLFEKYQNKRAKSMHRIKSRLADLRQQHDTNTEQRTSHVSISLKA
jgi:hypothetical protein